MVDEKESKYGKKVITVDGRTKDDIIRDQQKEIAKLRKEVMDQRAEHREQWERLCPQLPDEMRNRSRAVWEAALHAHQTAKAGEPGPSAVIARALLDAEKEGPRKLKGGVIDPVVFVAERIRSIALANKRDPMELFELISRRMMNPEPTGPTGPTPGENEADEGAIEVDGPEESDAETDG